MTRALLGTVAASGLLWLAAGTTIDGAKPPSDVPVAAWFANNLTDGLLGDGGAYVNRVDNVTSVILSGTGNYILDTNDRATIDGGRRLGIDFHGQPGAPFGGPRYLDVFVGTIGVTLTPADGSLATMAANADLQRRTRIGWVDNGQEYSLRFDNLAGDGVWNFHCDAGTPCTQWTVTPTGPATLYAITPSSKGRPAVETPVSQFSMPFSMTLTR